MSRADLKIEADTCRLAGTDDHLIRVWIDRAVPMIGGLWIDYRSSLDGRLSPWDEHGAAADLLTRQTRALMDAAAERESRRVA